MRAILALAILIVCLNEADPETLDQQALLTPQATASASFVAPEASIAKADRESVLAPHAELSDAPHDQGEEAAEPPQPPAPASTNVDAQADPAVSVDELCNSLLVSAEDNDLPVPFFANLIWQESRLQLDAVSRVGALGVAQFMPNVAVEVGLDDPFDPHQAIPASARFLHALREHFRNLGFVAAAYNAGAHRVAEWLDHRRALPLETRTYVVRVTGRSAEAWRKSPVDDSQLSFVRPLPCRKLPAFVELEQAQLQARLLAAQQAAEAHQQPRQEKIAANFAKEAAPEPVHKRASRAAQKTERKAPVAPHGLAERKAARKVAGAGVPGKMARNFHGNRHEAAHPQHGGREKHRVA